MWTVATLSHNRETWKFSLYIEERSYRPEPVPRISRRASLFPSLLTVRQSLKNRPKNLIMKKMIFLSAVMMLVGVSCNQTGLRRDPVTVVLSESGVDLEVRRLMHQGVELDERQRQARAIATVFARRTNPERAHRLASLCYLKTLGTEFMPLDLAEIALAETGSIGFDPKAVSPKGALGVWQLMPYRAESHGFSPHEMADDEKCAEAAVRELATKLEMARGNLTRAKKLYCGVGPEADAYEIKRRRYKRELLRELHLPLQVGGVDSSFSFARVS